MPQRSEALKSLFRPNYVTPYTNYGTVGRQSWSKNYIAYFLLHTTYDFWGATFAFTNVAIDCTIATVLPATHRFERPFLTRKVIIEPTIETVLPTINNFWLTFLIRQVRLGRPFIPQERLIVGNRHLSLGLLIRKVCLCVPLHYAMSLTSNQSRVKIIINRAGA
jgi:hypothetical protein